MAVVNMDLYSYELAMNTQISMILPEKRGVPHLPYEKKYPILYLLHGHGQDHTSWLRLSRIEFYLQNSDVIVVMPNVNRSSYVDGVNTHRYGSYFMKELPVALKNWFNITEDREQTFIAGMSMGGYGTLHTIFMQPERFGAACVMSSGIKMGGVDLSDKADKGLAIPDVPEIERNFVNTFGAPDKYDGSEYDLYALAKNVNQSSVYKPKILHLCGTEDPLRNQNLEFSRFMNEECKNFDYTYQEEKGIHDFDFWDRESITMLKFFGLI